MPLVQADSDTISQVNIAFKRGSADGGVGGSSFGGAEIFQFPPKIISDSKQAKWQFHHKTGYEPVAVFWGAESRRITLKAEWVVYNEWSPSKINNALLNIKSHLYLVGAAVVTRAPFVEMSVYRIAPDRSTWRLMDVSLQYSEEMVDIGKDAWPLHTEANLSLELFTQGGNITDKEQHENGIKALPVVPKDTWY
jgi:hypothetical protein